MDAEKYYPPPPQHFTCPQKGEPWDWQWWHHGIDFDLNSTYPLGVSCSNGTNGPGSTLYASRYGTVTIAQVGELQLQSIDGYYITYYHTQQVLSGLSPGSTVTRGEQIAEVGNYGTQYCHLHFEVTMTGTLGENGGQDVDPTRWIYASACLGVGFAPATHTQVTAAFSSGLGPPDLFIRGLDGSLYHQGYTQSPPSTSWTCFGGFMQGTPAVVYNPNDNYFYLVLRWPDSTIRVARWDGVSSCCQDSDWKNLYSPGAATSDPVAIVWNSTVYVLIRGADSNVYESYYSSGQWSWWTAFNANSTKYINGKPAVAVFNNQLYVVVRAQSDNTIWWDATSSGSMQPWTQITPTKAAASDGSLNADGSALQFVGYGTDSQVWEISFSGSSWGSWTPLSGHLIGDPNSLFSPSGRFDVLVHGVDGALWDYNGGWSSLGGIVTNDPLAAWIYDFGQSKWVMHVFVRGNDGALWENVNGANPPWINHAGQVS